MLVYLVASASSKCQIYNLHLKTHPHLCKRQIWLLTSFLTLIFNRPEYRTTSASRWRTPKEKRDASAAAWPRRFSTCRNRHLRCMSFCASRDCFRWGLTPLEWGKRGVDTSDERNNRKRGIAKEKRGASAAAWPRHVSSDVHVVMRIERLFQVRGVFRYWNFHMETKNKKQKIRYYIFGVVFFLLQIYSQCMNTILFFYLFMHADIYYRFNSEIQKVRLLTCTSRPIRRKRRAWRKFWAHHSAPRHTCERLLRLE